MQSRPLAPKGKGNADNAQEEAADDDVDYIKVVHGYADVDELNDYLSTIDTPLLKTAAAFKYLREVNDMEEHHEPKLTASTSMPPLSYVDVYACFPLSENTAAAVKNDKEARVKQEECSQMPVD